MVLIADKTIRAVTALLAGRGEMAEAVRLAMSPDIAVVIGDA
jgi:hypothetical protein